MTDASASGAAGVEWTSGTQLFILYIRDNARAAISAFTGAEREMGREMEGQNRMSLEKIPYQTHWPALYRRNQWVTGAMWRGGEWVTDGFGDSEAELRGSRQMMIDMARQILRHFGESFDQQTLVEPGVPPSAPSPPTHPHRGVGPATSEGPSRWGQASTPSGTGEWAHTATRGDDRRCWCGWYPLGECETGCNREHPEISFASRVDAGDHAAAALVELGFLHQPVIDHDMMMRYCPRCCRHPGDTEPWCYGIHRHQPLGPCCEVGAIIARATAAGERGHNSVCPTGGARGASAAGIAHARRGGAGDDPAGADTRQ